jgi:hypothetical protein
MNVGKVSEPDQPRDLAGAAAAARRVSQAERTDQRFRSRVPSPDRALHIGLREPLAEAEVDADLPT